MSDDETPRRSRIGRAARGIAVATGVLASTVLLLAALLHVPPVSRAATRSVLARASEALGGPVEAASLRWDFLTGTVEARDVALRGTGERAGTEISARRLHVDTDLTALLRGRLVVEEAALEQPLVRLALDEEGRLVFPFVLPEEDAEGPTDRPDVEVLSFRLEGGRVELVDRGPAGRRVALGDVALEGSLALRTLASRGSLAVPLIDVASEGTEPLRGSTLSARWETHGEAGTASARLEAKEAGLVLAADARFGDLSRVPAWEARLALNGALGPLAARLAPRLGLGGAIEAQAVVSGTGARLAAGTASARADGVAVLGRSFDRADLGLELDGPLLRKGTLALVAGEGRLKGEFSGRVRPGLEGLRFSVSADGLDVARLLPPARGGPRLGGALGGTIEGTLGKPELAALEAAADLAVLGSVAGRGSVLAPDVRVRARVSKGIVTVETATLSERTTRAELSGAYDHARGAFEGKVEAATADLGPWLSLFGLDGKGAVDVSLAGGGPVSRPALDGRLRARGLSLAGVRVDCVELDARSNGARFELQKGIAAAWGATAGFSAEGTLPLAGRRAPAIDLRIRDARFRGRPLPDLDAHADLGADLDLSVRSSDGSVSARLAVPARGGFRAEAALSRFDLAPLAPLLAGYVEDFGGSVTARLDAARPRVGPLEGTLALESAELVVADRHLSASGGAVRLAEDRFEVDRLQLRGDDGSLLAASGSGRADGSGLALSARFEVPSLAAWEALLPRAAAGSEKEPFEGRLSGDLRANGSLERPGLTGDVHVSGLRAFGVGLDRLDVTLTPEEGGRVAASAALAGLSRGAFGLPAARLEAVLSGGEVTAEGDAFDGRLKLKGTGSLAGARPFDATVTLDALDLSPYVRAAGGPAELAVTTTGRVRVRGAGTDGKALSVDAELDSLEAKGPEVDLRAPEPVRVAWDGSGLEVRSLRFEGPRLSLKATGSLPARGRGGRIAVASSLDLAALLPFLDLLDRASGRLVAEVDVTGSLAEPFGVGTLSVEDALLDGPSFPMPVERLTGTLVAKPGEVRTEGVSARLGGGSIVLAGVLREEDGRPKGIDATLKARDIDLEYGKDVQVLAGADLTAKGPWPSVLVAGEVRFEDVVWVPALDLTGVMKSLQARRARHQEKEAEARSPWMPGVSFDVALVARDAIHVEGLIGEAELGGTLRVKGTPDAPAVVGSISSTRGSVNLFGSVFDLTRCKLEFSDPLAVDPDLDVVATTTKADEEITIRVDGKASQAQLLLSSSKGRSQADIVSVLLGGSGTGSASELSAAAAKMALRGASSPLLGTLGAHADLEIVPLPTTPEGEEFLFSVGKDLGGGVSATYFKGVSGETTDAIEMKWRLSSRARGRLRQNQDGSLSGGFRIRHELD